MKNDIASDIGKSCQIRPAHIFKANWKKQWRDVDNRDFKIRERGRREREPEVKWHLRASLRMTKS